MGLEDKANTDDLDKILKEQTEIGEAFQFLQNDEEDEKGRPNIDFNTRLSDTQISGILVLDTLKDLRLLPENISLTRMLKRLNVSKNGEGRKELVSVAQGLREEKSNRSFLGHMFNKRE